MTELFLRKRVPGRAAEIKSWVGVRLGLGDGELVTLHDATLVARVVDRADTGTATCTRHRVMLVAMRGVETKVK